MKYIVNAVLSARPESVLAIFFSPQAPSKLLGSAYYFCTVTQSMPMPKIHTFFYFVFY